MLLHTLLLCAAAAAASLNYSVVVVDRDPMAEGAALVSRVNGSSAFNFSFNSAWLPATQSTAEGLVVRVVECNPDHHPCPDVLHPEWSNAGALAMVRANLSGPLPQTAFVGYADVVWPGTAAPPPRAFST